MRGLPTRLGYFGPVSSSISVFAGGALAATSAPAAASRLSEARRRFIGKASWLTQPRGLSSRAQRRIQWAPHAPILLDSSPAVRMTNQVFINNERWEIIFNRGLAQAGWMRH